MNSILTLGVTTRRLRLVGKLTSRRQKCRRLAQACGSQRHEAPTPFIPRGSFRFTSGGNGEVVRNVFWTALRRRDGRTYRIKRGSDSSKEVTVHVVSPFHHSAPDTSTSHVESSEQGGVSTTDHHAEVVLPDHT